jgi:tRNA(fMet)-specific endonuclease VapC
MAKLNNLPPEAPFYVSAISLGEVSFGLMKNKAKTQAGRKERIEFDRWIKRTFPPEMVLSVDQHTRTEYGKLKAALFKSFPPKSKKETRPELCLDPVTSIELGIDENDLWIAAQSLQRGLTLVTRDQMQRIRDVSPHLKKTVENWIRCTKCSGNIFDRGTDSGRKYADCKTCAVRHWW